MRDCNKEATVACLVNEPILKGVRRDVKVLEASQSALLEILKARLEKSPVVEDLKDIRGIVIEERAVSDEFAGGNLRIGDTHALRNQRGGLARPGERTRGEARAVRKLGERLPEKPRRAHALAREMQHVSKRGVVGVDLRALRMTHLQDHACALPQLGLQLVYSHHNKGRRACAATPDGRVKDTGSPTRRNARTPCWPGPSYARRRAS